jgi:hypothetical protein
VGQAWTHFVLSGSDARDQSDRHSLSLPLNRVAPPIELQPAADAGLLVAIPVRWVANEYGAHRFDVSIDREVVKRLVLLVKGDRNKGPYGDIANR